MVQPDAGGEIDWKKVAGSTLSCAPMPKRANSIRAGAARRSLKWWIGAEMRYAGQGHNVSVNLPWRTVNAAMAPALIAANSSAATASSTATSCRALRRR